MALTWPIIAVTFHSFSWVGVPATLVALPALPLIIATSAVTAVAGLFSGPLATALGWVSWLPLAYLGQVVELWARLPGTGFQIAGLPVVAVVAYYLALGGLLWLWSRRAPPTAMLGPALGSGASQGWRWGLASMTTAAALLWAMALTAPSDELLVKVLGVPDGQAILIEAPGRAHVLVDGGPSVQTLELGLARGLPFWDKHLDLLVSTSPAAPYLAAQVGVADRHRIGRALEAGPTESALYREWRNRLETQGIAIDDAKPGMLVKIGRGATLEVMGRGAEGKGVLRLTYGRVGILLAGSVQDAVDIQSIRGPADAVVLAGAGADMGGVAGQVVVVSGKPGTGKVLAAAGDQSAVWSGGLRDVSLRTDGRQLWVEEAR